MVKFIGVSFSTLRKGLFMTALISGGFFMGNSAYAISSKACHQQFEAAKKAGNIKNQTFKEYKDAFCKDEAAQNKDESKKSAGSTNTSDKKTSSKEAAVSSVNVGDAVFPNAVDAKYAKEKEGTARMHTCLDQYKANKANNKNGDLKWIQKGGGYYSECNKRLRGK